MGNDRPGANDCPRPYADARHDYGPRPDGNSATDGTRLRYPSSSLRCAHGGMSVVDEHDTVSHEHLVSQGYAPTEKRVALDPTTTTDACAALDFNECPDTSAVSNCAAVKVDEFMDHHVLPESDVFRH